MEAYFKAVRENDIDAFYAYCSPRKIGSISRRSVFRSAQLTWEFQAAFDQRIGKDRWHELAAAKGPSGATLNLSRIPTDDDDFAWFPGNAAQISDDEVHVIVPTERHWTAIRFQGIDKGWTVDLVKADFQVEGVEEDMDQCAQEMNQFTIYYPAAIAALNRGEKDFGAVVETLSQGFREAIPFTITPTD